MLLNNAVNMNIEDKILAAAGEEFYRSGFDAASTSRIAKSVGFTHAMVNYYFRTKEQLFLRILDSHVEKALSVLRVIMRGNSGMEETLTKTAEALFSLFNEDRSFPFLLLDASRSHPEYLARYRESLLESAKGVLEGHVGRLKDSIQDGNVTGLFENVLTLAYTPFLHIPFLTNVAGYGEQQVEDYLQRRKAEILILLKKRYSNAN